MGQGAGVFGACPVLMQFSHGGLVRADGVLVPTPTEESVYVFVA